MKTNNPDIGLLYYKGSFNRSELDLLDAMIATQGLHLASKERSPYINASIDFFFPLVQILFSPDMVAAITQGVLTEATYNTICSLFSFIRKKFQNSPVHKIQAGKVEKTPANIQVFIGNNRLVLPVDVDDEKFRYTIDRFIEFAANTSPASTTYSFYSEKDHDIIQKTEEEIIAAEYEQSLKRQQ